MRVQHELPRHELLPFAWTSETKLERKYLYKNSEGRNLGWHPLAMIVNTIMIRKGGVVEAPQEWKLLLLLSVEELQRHANLFLSGKEHD